MRDSLPTKPYNRESGIINLDDSHREGTHWVCYRKVGLDVYYFDSYGNLPPPKEFVNYMNDIEIFKIVMSYTFALTDKSCVRSCDVFPPLLLNDGRYDIVFLSFDTCNTIPNVNAHNNSVHFKKGKTFKLPIGTYEIEDIKNIIKAEFHNYDFRFLLLSNPNTFKVSIKLSDKLAKAGKDLSHYNDKTVDIFNVNVTDIQSNVSSGSYINVQPSHSLYFFSLKEAAGYKIRDIPTDIIYILLDVSFVENLILKIVDQKRRPVNFRRECITARLHIRKA
ncbi:hypothetical protein B566_EDAN013604 [Ephemera danica]|nr:hypothetical protein B566_EDAN013604 [Ephemera danica]